MLILRNVIVTGGTRGIGEAISREFIKNGDRVFAIYEKNEAAAEKLREECGAVVIKADVSKREDVDRALAEVNKYGDIDVLINNAGISQIKVFSDIDESEWDRMFDVNIKSMFLMTKAVLPDMIARKKGKIINISSIWGQTGGSCEVHYSASKAAVIGFTKALAKELGLSGICVNCIAPGVIETEMNGALGKETLDELKSEIPLNRTGEAAEVAKTAFFLAGEDADYITGQIIAVNGGMFI